MLALIINDKHKYTDKSHISRYNNANPSEALYTNFSTLKEVYNSLEASQCAFVRVNSRYIVIDDDSKGLIKDELDRENIPYECTLSCTSKGYHLYIRVKDNSFYANLPSKLYSIEGQSIGDFRATFDKGYILEAFGDCKYLDNCSQIKELTVDEEARLKSILDSHTNNSTQRCVSISDSGDFLKYNSEFIDLLDKYYENRPTLKCLQLIVPKHSTIFADNFIYQLAIDLYRSDKIAGEGVRNDYLHSIYRQALRTGITIESYYNLIEFLKDVNEYLFDEPLPESEILQTFSESRTRKLLDRIPTLPQVSEVAQSSPSLLKYNKQIYRWLESPLVCKYIEVAYYNQQWYLTPIETEDEFMYKVNNDSIYTIMYKSDPSAPSNKRSSYKSPYEIPGIRIHVEAGQKPPHLREGLFKDIDGNMRLHLYGYNTSKYIKNKDTLTTEWDETDFTSNILYKYMENVMPRKEVRDFFLHQLKHRILNNIPLSYNFAFMGKGSIGKTFFSETILQKLLCYSTTDYHEVDERYFSSVEYLSTYSKHFKHLTPSTIYTTSVEASLSGDYANRRLDSQNYIVVYNELRSGSTKTSYNKGSNELFEAHAEYLKTVLGNGYTQTVRQMRESSVSKTIKTLVSITTTNEVDLSLKSIDNRRIVMSHSRATHSLNSLKEVYSSYSPQELDDIYTNFMAFLLNHPSIESNYAMIEHLVNKGVHLIDDSEELHEGYEASEEGNFSDLQKDVLHVVESMARSNDLQPLIDYVESPDNRKDEPKVLEVFDLMYIRLLRHYASGNSDIVKQILQHKNLKIKDSVIDDALRKDFRSGTSKPGCLSKVISLLKNNVKGSYQSTREYRRRLDKVRNDMLDIPNIDTLFVYSASSPKLSSVAQFVFEGFDVSLDDNYNIKFKLKE